MKTTCRHLLGVLWLASLLLCAGTLVVHSASRDVADLRYSVSEGRSRIVIDCTGKFTYKIVLFHNPERIAVNLVNVKAPKSVRDKQVPTGIVRTIRVNRLSWGSQVVLDLRDYADFKDFVLGKTETKPERIVLDVWKSANEAREDENTQEPFIVAIDPGHGGSDPGAIGRFGLVEKDIALDIARQVASDLNRRNGFKAVLTRDRDKFLTLEKRNELARQFGGEAFVSIHLNSARKKTARGAEIFFLSPAGAASKASRLLADKKKTASELGVDAPDSDNILYMILDVNQQRMMLRSSLLAENILKAMRVRDLPPVRSMKQRSFAVLKTITMPSVIVEVGFLTNLHDARLLKSSKGRENIAHAISRGIVSFFEAYPPPRAGAGKVIVHKVKKGDSLWTIAKKYRISLAKLRRINKLSTTSTLQIGQRILIMNEN
jgi:N-acetylmuramoyl-L-alanine amidase